MGYTPWTLKKIAEALDKGGVGQIKIEVPKYQRNLVWSESQKLTFIDSIKRGFPIGSLLFYNVEGTKEYSLIDGLQRSTTIADFIKNPQAYFTSQDINDSVVDALFLLFNSKAKKEDFAETIKNEIQKFIAECDLSSNTLPSDLTQKLITDYASVTDAGEMLQLISKTVSIVAPCIKSFTDLYDEIANTEIPVIIYSGDESNLPTVFERINSQGTTLGKYQIYAATWAIDDYSVVVKNNEIIKHITDKYDAFVDLGYVLQNYDKDEIINTKVLSLFEYVLGYGKYISSKYTDLFSPDKSVQDINQVGFELINACFGCHNNDIKTLHKKLNNIDVNLMEEKIGEIIDFVSRLLKPYIQFKGNTRGSVTLYHAQYQIVSIIASTFRAKYDPKDLEHEKIDWKKTEKILRTTIPQHYFYDILAKNWADGNLGKLYSTVRSDGENKYLSTISKDMWEAKLDEWLTTTLSRREKTNISGVKPIEKLFLNCIYVKTFTAFDQLAVDKYDIEHLGTKNMIKQVIKDHNWEGLPISSIGNICLLPEYDNRKKKDKTIYQDQNYLSYLSKKNQSITDIEDKFTFTEQSDLDWMSASYNDSEYDVYLAKFVEYSKKRFGKMKCKFYEALQIV